MNKVLDKLNIKTTEFTKAPKKQKVFNKVKNGVPPIANYNMEADILYLPQTKEGFKYCLVMCDLANNKFDIQPMKNRNTDEAVEAFKKMVKRKYIKAPKISLRTDNGAEFQGKFDKMLKNNEIWHRKVLPYRHKQMANVESLNRQLGNIFNEYMNMKELETGEIYKEWTDILEPVRKELNNYREIKLIKLKDWKPKLFDPVAVKEQAKYKIGDLVHRKLDYPKNALNNNQPTANFRMGDFRWDTLARKVKKVVYMPDAPFYRYVLEGLPNVSYPEIELMPSKEKQQKYDVEKFLKEKVIKGNKFYLVKWKNYKVAQATWELGKHLKDDIGEKVFNAMIQNMPK